MFRIVLCPDYEHHSGEEFDCIVARIRELEPTWQVLLLSASQLRRRHRWMRRKPTLFVAWRELEWRPRWGCLLCGKGLKKSEQFAILQEAGFEVPKFVAIIPGTELAVEEWGDYVVVKPEQGARGNQVRIRRTSRVNWEEGPDLVAQEFVYTGPQPVSYRVQTLCGKAMYAFRSVNESCGEHLEDYVNRASFGGHNIVASARGARISLIEDTEILEFAERVAQKAFPEIPLLGLDVLRDLRTGRLAVAEVNPWGQTWHFSSRLGRGIQQENGLNFAEQFGLPQVAAEALVAAGKKWAC